MTINKQQEYCFVIDCKGKQLSPTSINNAWFLIRKERAKLINKYPMTIKLNKEVSNTLKEMNEEIKTTRDEVKEIKVEVQDTKVEVKNTELTMEAFMSELQLFRNVKLKIK